MSAQTFKLSRTYPVHQYQNWISQTQELLDTLPFSENVKYWGAKGNGISDDTTAIQNALNANLGGCLFFPPGIYIITSTLTINDNIQLKGCVGDVTGIVGNSSILRTNVATPLLSIGQSTAASPPWVNISYLGFWSTVITAGSRLINLYNMSQSYWESVMLFGSPDILMNLIPGTFGGVAQRVAYNTFDSMTIWGIGTTGVSNVVFNPTDAVGFANQNTFVGGRWVPANANVIIVDFFRGNHNQFYGISMESVTSTIGVNFRAASPAANISNLVDCCRFEGTYSTASIVDNGAYNIIRNGFHGSSTITKDVSLAGTINAGDTNIWSSQLGLVNLARFYRNNAGDASSWNTQIIDSYGPSGTSQVLRLQSLRANPASIVLLQAQNATDTVFTVNGTGVVNTTANYQVDAVQVVTNRQAGYNLNVIGANAATAINATTITATDPNIQALAAAFNAVKSSLITHGLIGA